MKRQNIKPSFDWSGHVILFFFSIARLCEWTTTEFTGRSKKIMDSIFLYNKKKDPNSFSILFQKKVSFLNEVIKRVRNYYFNLDLEYSIYIY